MAADIYYQAADYILAALGINPTATNVNILVAWMPNEYSADMLAVTNNPLASSQNAPGQVGYCDIPGVGQSSEPCYDTLEHGSAASAQTIANGYYPHLLAGLQNSDAATFFSSAGMQEICTWSGGACYGPKIQNTYQGLPTPPSWALTGVGSGTVPPGPVPVSKVLLWAGGIIATAGVAVLAWDWWQGRKVSGFARRRDESHIDARVDTKWMTYISATEKDAAGIAKPLSACDVYANVKAASERRGVPILEDRNLPEGVEAVYTPPEPGFPKGRIMLGVPVTRQAEKCMPYGVQTELHEAGHSVLHRPGCLPNYRGVSYSSENHRVEEQEVELGSFAAMVELGLPGETYEGTVYPAGTEEIDWALAKRNLDPDTYENVRWLTDVLVRAGQGDIDALANATCPFALKGA